MRFKKVSSCQPTGVALVSALAVASLICSACAWQSEVRKVGENTYQISASASPAQRAISGVREMALRTATAKCDSLGKTITVTDVQFDWGFPANRVATITFMCN